MIKIRNILFTILIVISFASNLGFSAELPRVSELSKAAIDLMINALIKTERFRVFERIII